MYKIINKTKKATINLSGSFPSDYIEKMLNDGDQVIVVSLYSNTIKVPYIDTDENGYGENVWAWTDYPFNPKSS
jgi:hypothetical protein